MNGLIAWWSFNEESGNIAHDSMGNNDGTIYGCNWTTIERHHYTKAGTYNVSLAVMDDDGAIDIMQKQVVVS